MNLQDWIGRSEPLAHHMWTRGLVDRPDILRAERIATQATRTN